MTGQIDGFEAYVAYELPDAAEYAEALDTLLPALARELCSAFETPRGWRLRVDPAGEALIVELRALGLVESPGLDPRSRNLGWYLGAFGLDVRRHLLGRA